MDKNDTAMCASVYALHPAFPALRRVGDDATSYHGNQLGRVIVLSAPLALLEGF